MNELRQSLESKKAVADECTVDLLVMMCTRWDYASRLAPLDVLRCAATSPIVAKYTNPTYGNIVKVANTAALDGVPDGSQPNENLAMMALRTIVNLFSTSEGREVLSSEASTAAGLVERILGTQGSPAIGAFNRNLMVALSTVCLNYSVLASKQNNSVPRDVQIRLMKAAAHVLENQTDSEVMFRAVVAAGTLVTVVGKADSKVLDSPVAMAKDRSTDHRVKEVAGECLALLR